MSRQPIIRHELSFPHRNCSFDGDEFAMYGDLPCEIAYNVEYQESSSQEEEDGTEASYDEEEIKATKGCSQDDFWLKTPPFIARTYEMISSCKPEVACWSDDGEMFIVKDQTVLARMYIPQYFGHSNFSSFERQLNLYGFRKNFSDVLRQLSGSDFQTDTSKEIAKYVRFHHGHFKRGRTDLLHLIKRANAKKSEKKKSAKRKNVAVQELKEELSSLESHLTNVVSEIEQKFALLSKDIEGKFEQMQRILSDTSNRLLQTQEHFEVERYVDNLLNADVDLDGQTLSEELHPLNLNFQRTRSSSELSHEMNSEIVSLLRGSHPLVWQAGLETMDQETNAPDNFL